MKNANKIEPSLSLPNIFQRFLLTFIPSSKPNPYRTTLETIKVKQETKEKSNLRSKVLHKEVCNARSKIIHNNAYNKYTKRKRNHLLYNCKSKIFFKDNRNVRLNEVIELLKIFQKSAAKYAICKNDLANDYLLKSRYKEDRENFFHSFHIEVKRI